MADGLPVDDLDDGLPDRLAVDGLAVDDLAAGVAARFSGLRDLPADFVLGLRTSFFSATFIVSGLLAL
ncbi:MAG: hypothetical protein R3C59_06870 [Planctomycetaceae bacterium]